MHQKHNSNDYVENARVRWTYKFAADSFPPHALDDHVQIGGHYFDLIDTEYVITPISPAASNLSVRMQFKVNTQFNWYAAGVARLLMGNFEETALQFYRRRAEQGMVGNAQK